MKINRYHLIRQSILSILLLIAGLAHAQSDLSQQPPVKSLYKEIEQMDSLLFEAFNNRTLDKIKTLFTSDLEFYHDKSGLTGYQQNMEAFATLFKSSSDLRRDLVKGSLEVYPVKDYGAIQTGMHRFCHTENGKQICGTFKFVHIWQKQNGVWKISRVVSYDHP